MKRFYRRRELFIYRIIFCIVFIITICILFKGFIVLASEDLNDVIDDVGTHIMQSIYKKSLSDESSYCRYVITNKSSDSNVLSNMADNFAINYYIAHGETSINLKGKDNKEEIEEELTEVELAENMDEDHRDYARSNKELEKMAIEENENIKDNNSEKLQIVFTEGKVSYIENYDSSSSMKDYVIEDSDEFAVSVSNLIASQYPLNKLKQMDYLLNNYYVVDSSTKATAEVFDTNKLLSVDLTIQKKNKCPQILIYHTHATEAFADSREGVEADTVVGAGSYLTELLEGYGYTVYHDKTQYDMKNGVSNRNYAYSTALPNIEKILKDNPTIEVIIDLHRDSGEKRVTTINGKKTAQIMLFNGLCRNTDGPIDRLENKNLQNNLAFSLQTNLVGRSLFPGLMYRIYLKNYRYNQHLAGRYLLAELGTVKNTVEEAYNAMEPFAAVLDQVLSNK